MQLCNASQGEGANSAGHGCKTLARPEQLQTPAAWAAKMEMSGHGERQHRGNAEVDEDPVPRDSRRLMQMLSRLASRLNLFQVCPNYVFIPGSASGFLWPSWMMAGESQTPKCWGVENVLIAHVLSYSKWARAADLRWLLMSKSCNRHWLTTDHQSTCYRR